MVTSRHPQQLTGFARVLAIGRILTVPGLFAVALEVRCLCWDGGL